MHPIMRTRIPTITDIELKLLQRKLYAGKIYTHSYNEDFLGNNPSTMDFRYVSFNEATEDHLEKRSDDFYNFEVAYLDAACRLSLMLATGNERFRHLAVTAKIAEITHFIQKGEVFYVHMKIGTHAFFGPMKEERTEIKIPAYFETELKLRTDLEHRERE